jgi:hypothetical protein
MRTSRDSFLFWIRGNKSSEMRSGHGAGVSRACDDAATSEPFAPGAANASPGPADGAPATAMAKRPTAKSEPIKALALIQRSNSRASSADQFRVMSRFSKTPSTW